MRILLDANIPQKLKLAIAGHDVVTARELNFNDLPDGELLDSMGADFDVLLTMDRSLQFQQDLRSRRFAVVILAARSNRLSDLLPLTPELLRQLPFLRWGEVRTISG